MAVRTPLKLDGSNVKEMSSAEITQIKDRCAYLYAGNPSVTVSRVANNAGNLTPMIDTGMDAGNLVQNNTHHPALSSLDQPAARTVFTFDRTSENVTNLSQNADTANIRNFCYLDGSNNIRAFSHTDMYDTFYNDVINTLVDGNDRPGTYRIGPGSGGNTIVNGTSVFTDTVLNIGGWSPGVTSGNPTTSSNPAAGAFFLYKTDQGSAPSMTLPIRIRNSSNAELRVITQSDVDTLLRNDIRYWATQKIRYSINGSGQQKGSAMQDRRRTGATRTTRQSGDNYFTQAIPGGSTSVINTYTLRIRKI